MGIGADVEFKPTNQDEVLLGNAEFSVSPAPLQMTGSMSILGRWIEPFTLTNFAVQNPGFVLTLDFSAGGIPVPTSIGWNVDMFWKKSGDWPDLLPPDVPAPPSNVLALGSSFFYDAIPSESGLCFVGPCVPTTPLIFRKNLQNLTLSDVVSFTNNAVTAVTAPFSGFIPTSDIEPLDPAPVSINVRTLQFVASTHNMDLFGQPFTAGVRFEFDAEVNGVNTFFLGSLDPEGVLVIGRQDGFAIPGAAFVGDPFWRELYPSTGYVEVGHNSALQPSTGLVEGWVRRNGWSGTLAGELARKTDGTNGWILGVGEQSDGLGRVQVQIANGGATRTLSSDPIVPANEDAHIAWQFDGTEMALFHEGSRLTVTDTGPNIAPGSNSSALQIGRGMERVDDVRIWDTNRSASQIGGQSRQLPTRFINPQGVVFADSPLVARYEFDWDRDGNTAYNSELVIRGPHVDAVQRTATADP
ncbi:MAG: LamG-like jellyroll fold domain-containing protein, partial [Myxococcota bacterium]